MLGVARCQPPAPRPALVSPSTPAARCQVLDGCCEPVLDAGQGQDPRCVSQDTGCQHRAAVGQGQAVRNRRLAGRREGGRPTKPPRPLPPPLPVFLPFPLSPSLRFFPPRPPQKEGSCGSLAPAPRTTRAVDDPPRRPPTRQAAVLAPAPTNPSSPDHLTPTPPCAKGRDPRGGSKTPQHTSTTTVKSGRFKPAYPGPSRTYLPRVLRSNTSATRR